MKENPVARIDSRFVDEVQIRLVAGGPTALAGQLENGGIVDPPMAHAPIKAQLLPPLALEVEGIVSCAGSRGKGPEVVATK